MLKPAIGKQGYPLLFFNMSKPWRKIALITTLILLAGIVYFVLFAHFSDDWSGDSIAGYIFAVLGTVFLVLAAISFTKKRHARKRDIGELNTALNWHVSFAIISFVFLCLHSFGNLNPRTGTYALLGMVALVISGFIGRTLDRLMPRFIAVEAKKALTARGEDRIETISRRLEAIVVHNKQEVRGFTAPSDASLCGIQPLTSRIVLNDGTNPLGSLTTGQRSDKSAVLPTSWDLAYISLEETPQELSRMPQYRLVPDKKSAFTSPGTLLPGAQEQMDELHTAQQALQREQTFRYVIRYWRVFHILLAIVTVALTLWHIEYALALLIPLMHF